MRTGEIATIRTGYPFRDKVEPDPDGNIAIIQIKDIEDRRRLSVDTLDRIEFDKPAEQYRVSHGDVLFLSRGHRQFAIAIEDDLTDTIASGYFYILRPEPHISPAYLAWAINQPPFQHQLAALTQGTHMRFVSLSAFQDLTVHVPPPAVQKAIVALSELADHEQSILAELATKRAALIQSLTNTAAAEATTSAKSIGR